MREYNVYFASCMKEGGIYHYKATADGKFRLVGKTPCDRPMYLICGGNRLHVVLRAPFAENDFSGIMTYEIDSEGRLGRPSELISTQGRCGCHLCELDGKIYVANYLSGSIFCSVGSLKSHYGQGVNPYRQEAPHTHCVLPSPDGRYLLVTDLGLDKIYVYDYKLNDVSVAEVPPGAGPRHLAWLNESYLVCVNELACTVTMMRYKQGIITPVQTISVLETERTDTVTSAAIRVCGSHVFVSNRGSNTISMIEVLGERMELKSVAACGGLSPRDFAIMDRFLLCANQESSTVTILKIEAEGLRLLEDKTIGDVEAVVCVCGDWD